MQKVLSRRLAEAPACANRQGAAVHPMTRLKNVFSAWKSLSEKKNGDAFAMRMGGLLSQFGFANCLDIRLRDNGPFEQAIFAFAIRYESEINSWQVSPQTIQGMQGDLLSGMRILDLGCGSALIFPRFARHFGAEVFTVDSLTSSSFVGNPPSFMRTQEIQNHIKMDIAEEDAVSHILEITGGRFDLVTASHLPISLHNALFPSDSLEPLAPLLKNGGMCFCGYTFIRWMLIRENAASHELRG